MMTLSEAKTGGAALWLVAAISFWLLPFVSVAAKKSAPAFFPSRWRLQMASAAVFTHHNTSWSGLMTMMRHGPNSEWVQIPTSELTPLQIAGYRYRWDRLVWDMTRKKVVSFWPRAADHAAQKWRELNPQFPAATEVRIVKILRRYTDPAVILPVGHWELPPLETVAAGDRIELAYCKLQNGVWVNAGKWRAPTASKPSSAETAPGNSASNAPVRRRTNGAVGPSGSPSLLPLIRPSAKGAPDQGPSVPLVKPKSQP